MNTKDNVPEKRRRTPLQCFLCKTGVFVAAILLLVGMIEVGMFRLGNDYLTKRRYMDAHAGEIRTLVMGDSHAANGIDANWLGDSAYNLAMMGRPPYYDAVLARRYFPRMKQLRCVIWPLGYNVPYRDFFQWDEVKRKELQCKYEKYMGISYEEGLPFAHVSEVLNTDVWYVITHPDFRYAGYDALGFYGKDVAQRPDNWAQADLPEALDYDSEEARRVRGHNMQYILELARLCNGQGVRLVVVTAPAFVTHRQLTTDRGRQELQRSVEEIRAVCPGMEYYNFLDDPRFGDADFFNASHLSCEGAAKFSRILGDTLHLR